MGSTDETLVEDATKGAGRGSPLKGYRTPVRKEVFRPEVPGASRRPEYTAPRVSAELNASANSTPRHSEVTRPRFFPWDIVDIRTDFTDPLAYSLYRPLIRADRLDIDNAITVTIDGGDFVPEADAWLVAEITAVPVTAVTIKLITDADWAGEPEHPSCYAFDTVSPYVFERARIPLWRFYDANTTGYPGGRIFLGADDDVVYGEKLVPDGPLQVIYTIAEVPGQNRVRAVPDLI